jgi:hypothetical protein
VEKSCVHQDNALSLTALCARTRYELTKTKMELLSTDSPYKSSAIKANGSRVITTYNIMILINGCG